jgi:hypothetical protein
MIDGVCPGSAESDGCSSDGSIESYGLSMASFL